MTSLKHLYTIGYEGIPLPAFIELLKDADVKTLVDVRELPLSRKRGFSKRALAAVLSDNGIAYAHMPTLGCPKVIRDRLKNGGDWDDYVRDFSAHLSKQMASVSELAKIARSTTTCLMCFEADFNRCHRSLVARSAVRSGAPKLSHITSTTIVDDAVRQQVA